MEKSIFNKIAGASNVSNTAGRLYQSVVGEDQSNTTAGRHDTPGSCWIVIQCHQCCPGGPTHSVEESICACKMFLFCLMPDYLGKQILNFYKNTTQLI